MMSQRQYAAHRGVSHVAVGKAVKAGRIATADGKIDSDLADTAWSANTRVNLSNEKAKAKAGKGSTKRSPGPSAQPAAPSAPGTEIDETETRLRRALRRDERTGQPLEAQGHGGAIKGRKDDNDAISQAALALARGDRPSEGLKMADAQLAHELIKIDERRTDVVRKQGELVARAPMNALFFERSRSFRDGLMEWSQSTAPLLADELSAGREEPIPAHDVTVALERHVRKFLARIAGVTL